MKWNRVKDEGKQFYYRYSCLFSRMENIRDKLANYFSITNGLLHPLHLN
jgi:hypothetical protein